MTRLFNRQLDRTIGLTVAGILLLLPFDTVLSVWLGSNFGHYTAWRLVMSGVLGALTLAAIMRGHIVSREFWRRPIVLCIGAYGVLHLGLGVWALSSGRVTAVACADALILNLRFLLFFLVCLSAAGQWPLLKQQWTRLLLGPALLVVGFGLMQFLVLPHDVLRHVGYGPHTILPYETVDQKADYLRVQSTLRGPNPLGAYVVLAAPALLGFATAPKVKRRAWFMGGLAVTGVVLFASYSRSAYLGAAVALGLMGWWAVKTKRVRVWLIAAGFAALALTGGSFLALRHNDRFQNTFFHTDEHSRAAESSNHQRAAAITQGVRDIWHEPLGRGPGTAGPASAHNAPHPARIAENYYLQIGQEVGVLGVGLFVAIQLLVVQKLYARRAELLPRVLLASLAGITLISLLSHAWADETLSMIWWGLAGIALAQKETDADN